MSQTHKRPRGVEHRWLNLAAGLLATALVAPHVSAGNPLREPSEPQVFPRATLEEDLAMQRSIEEELQLNPRVDDASVTVRVRNGVAVLTGTVLSDDAREEAARNALDGGAVRVINYLDVRLGSSLERY